MRIRNATHPQGAGIRTALASEIRPQHPFR